MSGSRQDQKNQMRSSEAGAAFTRHTVESSRRQSVQGHSPCTDACDDTVTALGRSLVHHGPHNDRAFLYHLDPTDLPEITGRLGAFAKERGYSRIFARIPATALDQFVSGGYTPLVRIPGLFRGEVDGYYLAYRHPTRGSRRSGNDEVLAVAMAKAGERDAACPALEPCFTAVRATAADAPAVASIYRSVFETYPVPIHDPGYLAQKMQENLRCFCVIKPGSRIVAVAAAEVDARAEFAEMTGFATLPGYRGHGFAAILLQLMEDDVYSSGIKTVFAIARAGSYPANITFARAGYAFAGALSESVNICGSVEDMNVWWKSIGVSDRSRQTVRRGNNIRFQGEPFTRVKVECGTSRITML